MPNKKKNKNMSEKDLLFEINEKLSNLLLAMSVSGKNFQEQVAYLNNLGYKPGKISEVVGRPRQNVKDMVKFVRGKKIIQKKDEIALRLDSILRLMIEKERSDDNISKSVYCLKSVGLSNMDIASIVGVKPNSIPSYIREYENQKGDKKFRHK